MVEAPAETASLNTDSGGRISLRIGVDEQNAISPTGDNRGEIHRGGGFSDPAFLVRDGYRLSHKRINLTQHRPNEPQGYVSRVPCGNGTRETSCAISGAPALQFLLRASERRESCGRLRGPRLSDLCGFLLGGEEDEEGREGARRQAGQTGGPRRRSKAGRDQDARLSRSRDR